MNTSDTSKSSEPSKKLLLGCLWVIQGLVALMGAIASRNEGLQPILWLVGFYLVFCGLQYGLLQPMYKPPTISGAAKPPKLWISTILLGLLIGLLMGLIVLLLGDIVWLFFDNDKREPIYWGFGLVAGLTMLVSWVFFTRYIRAFLHKGPIDVQLRRTANRLFLGSVIEVIAGHSYLHIDLAEGKLHLCNVLRTYGHFRVGNRIVLARTGSTFAPAGLEKPLWQPAAMSSLRI